MSKEIKEQLITMSGSLSSPPVVITPTFSSSSNVCFAFIEELQQDGCKLADPCPVCNLKVGFHQRKAPLSSVSTSAGFSTPSNYCIPTAVVNSLPKWKVDQHHARQFLLRYEQVLSSQNVPSTYWPRALLIGVTNVTEASWIQTNIVEPNKPWQEAKELFTKHFGNFVYESDLVRRYENCAQRPKDSVQNYSDYFTQLADEMNLTDDNDLVIQHFIEGLKPDVKQDLKRHMHLEKRLKPDTEFSSLKDIIELVLHLNSLDLNNSTKGSNRIGDDTKSNSSASPRKNKLFCKNHPDSSSHSTSECRLNYGPSNNASTSAKQQVPAKKKEVKCHLCGGPHYANDPNCPKRSSITTRSSATAPSAGTYTPTVSGVPSKPAASTASQPPIQNRSIDLKNDDEVPIQSSNVGIIERSPHEDVILPARKNVMFLVQNKAFNSLVDTGATTSFIDEALVRELQLTIEPSPTNSRISLGHANLSAARIGRVRLYEFVALFPFSNREIITLSHTFEVMPIIGPHKDYHFVIGSELIPSLFPEGIPLCYVPVASTENGTPSIVIRSSLVVPETTADTGYAELPALEQPNRPIAYTPAGLQHVYSEKRESLLQDLAEALSINERITGFCNLPESVVKLEIDPSKENSLYTKQYPIAQALREPADLVIQRWFSTGKICLAPTGCKYNNPLTIAPKKDENGVWTGIRVCLDVRRLNKALIVADKFPIPNIRKVLESFGGNSVFGEFDLSEAYLQFQLHPDSQPLTAFTWYGQQYMFVGCPYGITLLTSYFQRVMMRIFSDMPYTIPYVDNIPFASTDWKSHRDHAFMIINRLTQCNLRLKQSWHIGHAELRCLGHIINAKGTCIDPDKLSAVNDWPLPAAPADLQSFLGLCSFLRSHVRHFADLTGPLEAIKNQKELIWNDTLIHHFEMVKKALSTAPVLSYPDFDRCFHIATDASNTGVGGVLFQPTSSEEHITPFNIVAICSKHLNPRQQHWSAYKKELFGVVYSLRKFHTYVWGRTDLVLHTDHKPLTHMFSSSQLSPALQQWLDTILDYSFEIRHRDGILNVIPDQLSRMFGAVYSNVPVWGAVDLAKHSSEPLPDQISIRLSSLEEGKREPDSQSDSNTDPKLTLAIELEKRGKKCPATEAERIELIQQEHQFGHFGRDAIFRQLFNKGYWWPSIRKEIETELKNCDPCTRFVVVKSGFHPAQFITSSGPCEHIQIDTSVHLPESPDGYKALLVCLDVFTGFVFLRPLRDTTAETVARKLWKVFCIIGIPKILQSDNGSEFVNDILRSLVKITGIEHRFISPYNPRADGKVERSIGTCMMIIKKLLHGTNKNWPIFTSFAQITFNNKISSLTGSSPFALMFGRELNELKDYSTDPPTIIPLDDWKTHQEKIISLIYPAISDRIKSGKDKLVQALNKNRRLLLSNAFPSGATVMIIDPVRKDKFEPKYIGPYTIVRRARGGAYVLKDATGDILDRHIPADKMKLIAKSKRKIDDDNPIYQINKIISHRGSPGSYEYLIDWKGYSEHERSWEPEASFLDNQIIRDYWHTVNADDDEPDES